jgi:hypothetical protein
MEEIANRFGVAAQQVMLPVDHLFLPGTHSGPMIAIAGGSGAFKHFLVLWRISGDRVQVMDPASGSRSWVDQSELRERLYVHQMVVPANAWKEWSHGEEFHACLFERMRRLGVPASAMNHLWADALSDSSLIGLQALDATIRLAAARPRRTDVLADVQRVFGCSRRLSCSGRDRAPREFWSAWDGGTDSSGQPRVTIRGVVLLNFNDHASGGH